MYPYNYSEPVIVELKIATNNKLSSEKIGKCWRSIYEMMTEFIEGELPDGG
jgi:hypothetical protein